MLIDGSGLMSQNVRDVLMCLSCTSKLYNNFYFVSLYIETWGRSHSATLRSSFVLGTELIVGEST